MHTHVCVTASIQSITLRKSIVRTRHEKVGRHGPPPVLRPVGSPHFYPYAADRGANLDHSNGVKGFFPKD